MDFDFASTYLEDIKQRYQYLKSLADRALAQVRDEELPIAIDEESNSLTVLMKHLSGNMIHFWTDPFSPEEERPPRHRDLEFVVEEGDTKEIAFERWERAWDVFLESLNRLKPDDLGRSIILRGEEYMLLIFLNRNFRHYAIHVGQIMFLAKHFRGRDWKSLSVPRKR
jgi:uncharacterized damage-inducible protein DinB